MRMGNVINKTALNPMMYSQIRLTTYLVGVDGSQYGYGALQTASQICTANDKLISIYFPLNIAVESILFNLCETNINLTINNVHVTYLVIHTSCWNKY